MTRAQRRAAAAFAVAAVLAVSACSGSSTTTSTAGKTAAGTKNVQVFTWWAAGGEKAGLDGLQSVFKKDCSQYTFVNAAVAGGGGDKAKTLLANNLKAGNAPSSFQAHAGGELSDYIANGQVEDITALFKSAGLDTAFPKDLLTQITVADKVYSVPANIHRANMVWVNPAVLKKAKLDPAKAPPRSRTGSPTWPSSRRPGWPLRWSCPRGSPRRCCSRPPCWVTSASRSSTACSTARPSGTGPRSLLRWATSRRWWATPTPTARRWTGTRRCPSTSCPPTPPLPPAATRSWVTGSRHSCSH